MQTPFIPILTVTAYLTVTATAFSQQPPPFFGRLSAAEYYAKHREDIVGRHRMHGLSVPDYRPGLDLSGGQAKSLQDIENARQNYGGR